MTAVVLLFAMVCCGTFAQKKIHVHLCPHTHDDTGWLKTVDQYHYGSNNSIQFAGTRYILDSVIDGLLKDPNRRFTYVEQAFFWRWWEEKDNATRVKVRNLVSEDRLQFVNGGWCMHDEANPHYIDMIDQMTLGHRFLKRELNVTPKIGWQIDPFGHSNTNAFLLSARAGFIATFFGRADFQNYNWRAANRMREFTWQPSASLPQWQLLGGVLLTNHYGPPPSFHWDVTNPSCEPIQDDPRLEDYNVQEKVEKFVSLALEHANHTLGSAQMWTMGDDFNYQASDFWFRNLDALIKFVNADGRVEASYSTPYLYAQAKLGENLNFTLNTEDFFPYEDCPHCFWTGYFTSRPALKRYVRSTSAYYTAARQIQFGSRTKSQPVSLLADAMGLAQHHDAVAGTAKQHVAFDYAKRIAEGVANDLVNTTRDLAALSGLSVAPTFCPLLNVSVCSTTAVGLGNGTGVQVLVWNSLGRQRTNETVFIPVPTENVTVDGYVADVVPTPDFWCNNYDFDPHVQPFQLAVQIPTIPAAGYVAFTITPIPRDEQVPQKKKATATPLALENEYLQVTFAAADGWVSHVTNKVSGVSANVTHEWCYYESNTGDALSNQESGAYIFRPKTNTTCQPIATSQPPSLVLNSPSLQVVERYLSDFIVERLYLSSTDRMVRHEFTVGRIPIGDGVGKEIVSRFQTSVESGSNVYTDSNGREMQHRQFNVRNFPFVQTEPVAGNYYPVNALAFINDTTKQFGVLVDSSIGGGSLAPGSLELMIHRRILHDDGRGVGEPLNETEFITPYHECGNLCGTHYGPGLIVRGQHRWAFEATSTAMSTIRPAMDEVYAQPQLFFSSPPQALAESSGSVLAPGISLPVNVQLTTLQVLESGEVLVRLAHQFATGEDPNLSNPAVVDLQGLFSETISNVDELSITTNTVISSGVTNTTVTISPMDVRTFLATF